MHGKNASRTKLLLLASGEPPNKPNKKIARSRKSLKEFLRFFYCEFFGGTYYPLITPIYLLLYILILTWALHSGYE